MRLMQDEEIEFCMVCGEPNPPDREICECGGRNFVYGRNFTYSKEDGVICDCGSKEFQMTFHMNSNPIYTKNYKCVKCGNLIGVQTYYESPYMD